MNQAHLFWCLDMVLMTGKVCSGVGASLCVYKWPAHTVIRDNSIFQSRPWEQWYFAGQSILLCQFFTFYTLCRAEAYEVSLELFWCRPVFHLLAIKLVSCCTARCMEWLYKAWILMAKARCCSMNLLLDKTWWPHVITVGFEQVLSSSCKSIMPFAASTPITV